MNTYDKIHETATFLREQFSIRKGQFFDHTDLERGIIDRTSPRRPRVGLVLGSGLGDFADSLEDSIAVDYGDIPHFPRSSVAGHAGRLVLGDVAGVRCIAMQGRVHGYEGFGAEILAFPTRVMIALGVEVLIVTNAAGGLCPDWEPGTLMMISDHINMLGDNPLRGHNDGRIGPRFPDMTNAYCPSLRKLVMTVAQGQNIVLREGVYVAMPGPTYETPAEVRMLQTIGASATGMSTVPEVIAANHMGARAIGISCITNKAAGITGEALSHDEVTETANKVKRVFQTLIREIIAALPGTELVADSADSADSVGGFAGGDGRSDGGGGDS